MSSKVEVLSF